jgi:protein phosphatase
MPSKFAIQSVGLSDVGMKRSHNEDALLIDDEMQLYLVADGMGGHAAGEIASNEGIVYAQSMVRRNADWIATLHEPIDEDTEHRLHRLMESAIQMATYMVFSMAELEREKSGMGTTMCGLLFAGESVVVAHVGDSRVYRIRGDAAEQLTEDHTLIAWQLSQGIITPEQAKRSPHKNVITRAVGNRDYVQVDTSMKKIAAGDRFLICSDGLHNYVANHELPVFFDGPLETTAAKLIDLANTRGGKDNITVICVSAD